MHPDAESPDKHRGASGQDSGLGISFILYIKQSQSSYAILCHEVATYN
jgi:hypothetical protein